MPSLLWPGLMIPTAAGCLPRSFFPRPGPLTETVLASHGRIEGPPALFDFWLPCEP